MPVVPNDSAELPKADNSSEPAKFSRCRLSNKSPVMSKKALIRESRTQTQPDAMVGIEKMDFGGITPMSNGEKKMAVAKKSPPGPDTLLAHRRLRYPLADCFPAARSSVPDKYREGIGASSLAEPASVSSGSGISSELNDRNQPLDIGVMPRKIHRGMTSRSTLQDASAMTNNGIIP